MNINYFNPIYLLVLVMILYALSQIKLHESKENNLQYNHKLNEIKNISLAFEQIDKYTTKDLKLKVKEWEPNCKVSATNNLITIELNGTQTQINRLLNKLLNTPLNIILLNISENKLLIHIGLE